jgi:hypothetical protein
MSTCFQRESYNSLSDMLFIFSSKAKELHVVCASHGYTVTYARRVDALHTRSVDGPCVTALGIVGLGALRLVVVVSKDTSPFLHSLLVVLWTKRGIRATMVDLHFGTAAAVAGIHVGDNLGPGLRCGSRFALSAGTVPGGDATGVGHEAASGDTRVDDGGLEYIRISSSHDVLDSMLVLRYRFSIV